MGSQGRAVRNGGTSPREKIQGIPSACSGPTEPGSGRKSRVTDTRRLLRGRASAELGLRLHLQFTSLGSVGKMEKHQGWSLSYEVLEHCRRKIVYSCRTGSESGSLCIHSSLTRRVWGHSSLHSRWGRRRTNTQEKARWQLGAEA